MSCERIIEGVTYYRYRVRFQTAGGRRLVWIRWAPARLYALESVGRELVNRFGLRGIKPGSCTVRAA